MGIAMKKNEFANLSYDEICRRELELRNELMLLRLKKKIGQLEKTHRFAELRRNIARIVTIKAQRKEVSL
jgi:ribosomal protein L29